MNREPGPEQWGQAAQVRATPSSPSTRGAFEGGACFSACGRYRYALWRRWSPGPTVMIVGLNPSTADARHDDATIRRCVAFAHAWNYGGLWMANLFALRAVHPSSLRRAADPVGAENDRTLQRMALGADLVVAAWGIHGSLGGRDAEVLRLLPELQMLRLTRDGHPSHPLYLPAGLKPQPWRNR